MMLWHSDIFSARAYMGDGCGPGHMVALHTSCNKTGIDSTRRAAARRANLASQKSINIIITLLRVVMYV